MGKGGTAKQQVNEYNLSMHFGICAELDAITGIYVGEKQAWSGMMTSAGAISVQNEYLFGGPKKEGGVRGIAYYLPGDKNQAMPDGLAARRGLTSATSPGYRGLASVYFVGSLSPGLGFYWGATPYLQTVWITGRRAPKGLDPAYAMIGNQVAGSFDGYNVTIAGATAKLVDGVLATVGSHSASLTISSTDGTKTLVLDGLTVTVKPYTTDDSGNQQSGTTVGVEGNEQTLTSGSITINGVTVTVAGGVVGIAMGTADGTDANPAHIVYECLTNGTWGMGATNALVDQTNMEAVGQVLYHEGFGLSLQWTRESSIEQFVSEVLDHIQAALYVDPDTGKLTLKLFRDDYDPTTLPLISPDNAVLDNYQRKLWGETINEIIVTWTNPANEKEETITQQDLGNITVQGATISDSRNYYGVRNSDLATRLAIRDVRQSSAPLASVEALLDRSSWNLKPGSVVRLTWPEYSISNLVMRVTSIDYGKIGTPSITVTLLEDIFSLESADFDSSPSTGFVSGAQSPTPLDRVRVITAPAYFTSRYLTAADAAMLTYPDVMAAVLGGSSNPDASFYETVGVTTLPNGDLAAEVRSTHGLLSYSTLGTAFAEEASTIVPAFLPGTQGIGPNVAGFLFIGNVGERTQEIALIESFDSAGWHLARGVLDTVPRAWPAGTPIWFYDIRNNFLDTENHSDGETVNFKFLTVTSLGVLDVSAAPPQGATLTGRPFYPNRPGNVKVAGQAFGVVDLSASSPTTIPITWANRNRTLEDSNVVRWADATVVPEANQTTTIKLTKTTDGSVITTIDGLTGTSYDLPASAFNGAIQADVTFTAKRDGYESLMGVTRRVRIVADSSSPGTPAMTPDQPYVPPTAYPPTQDPPRYCVEETARVLLASPNRRTQGSVIAARDLKPGMFVWTRNEDTMRWGAFEVTAVDLIEQPVLKAGGFPRATEDHRFWTGAGWTRMGELGTADGTAMVALIAVRDARTYTTVNSDGTLILSHNIKQQQLDYQ